MGGRHITITADVLLLQSSNVMRKFVPTNALIERQSLPYSWHQRGTNASRSASYLNSAYYVFDFRQLLRLLQLVALHRRRKQILSACSMLCRALRRINVKEFRHTARRRTFSKCAPPLDCKIKHFGFYIFQSRSLSFPTSSKIFNLCHVPMQETAQLSSLRISLIPSHLIKDFDRFLVYFKRKCYERTIEASLNYDKVQRPCKAGTAATAPTPLHCYEYTYICPTYKLAKATNIVPRLVCPPRSLPAVLQAMNVKGAMNAPVLEQYYCKCISWNLKTIEASVAFLSA